MKVGIKKSKNNRKTARLNRNNVNNKKRRNKSRNKTKRKKNKTKRNKRKSSNKIIHNQSGGILSEDIIINQIPPKYKYDLDDAGEELWPGNTNLDPEITAKIEGLNEEEAELKEITVALTEKTKDSSAAATAFRAEAAAVGEDVSSDLVVELRGLVWSALKKRALSVGVDDESVDEAMDADDHKTALIGLIVELRGSPADATAFRHDQVRRKAVAAAAAAATEAERYTEEKEETASRLETIRLFKYNIPRVLQAIPLFNEKILQGVGESRGKFKVYIIFTFMRWGFGVIKPLHPIICITGTGKSNSDISRVNSTYEFVADTEGVGVVWKGVLNLFNGSRLCNDKVRALGFIGHFATTEDAMHFKTKLENDSYLDSINRGYNIITNNCQHFVAKILEDLKTSDNFVPGGELYGRWLSSAVEGKNMLDLDIMQGTFLKTISNPSTFAGIVGSAGSLAGSSAAIAVAPVAAVATASVVGGAAAGGVAYSIGKKLEKELENVQVEGLDPSAKTPPEEGPSPPGTEEEAEERKLVSAPGGGGGGGGLEGLKWSELEKRAQEFGVSEAQIDEAFESDNRKEALIDIMLVKQAMRSAKTPAPSGGGGGGDLDTRVGLEGLKPSELRKRAKGLGASEDLLEEAYDSAQGYKAELIDIVLGLVPPRSATELPANSGWLRQEEEAEEAETPKIGPSVSGSSRSRRRRYRPKLTK
jgi:hypothetical protein